MVDKSSFDFKAIPRGSAVDLTQSLEDYLSVYRALTGESSRRISVNVFGYTSFFSSYRRQGISPKAELYAKVVWYMDEKLEELSGKHGSALAAWVHRRLSAMTQDEFEAAQIARIRSKTEGDGIDDRGAGTAKKRARTAGGIKKQGTKARKSEGKRAAK